MEKIVIVSNLKSKNEYPRFNICVDTLRLNVLTLFKWKHKPAFYFCNFTTVKNYTSQSGPVTWKIIASNSHWLLATVNENNAI